MKTLKIVLVVVLAILAITLIVAAIAPKDYALVREITINRPLPTVFSYVKYLKNQDNFSVWARKDTLMAKEYTGTDGTVGFKTAWKSKDEHVGEGEQEITAIDEGKRINYELHFIKPMESRDHAFMEFESVGPNQTKVRWGFSGRMPVPLNILLLAMDMDKMLGKDFSDGLTNLKGILEQ